MTTPTISSDNTQTVYNLLDERKEMLADILKLREALLKFDESRVEFENSNYHESDILYVRATELSKQALNETQKWEKGK